MRLCLFVACAIVVVPFSAGAVAGPLNPPAGAVSSTGKPLAELQPRTVINATNTPGDSLSEFIISQPGSYVLGGNVSTAKGYGLRITAANVTVDLCGFEVANTSSLGYSVFSDQGKLTLSNGRLVGWAGLTTNALGTQVGVTDLEIVSGGECIRSNGPLTARRCRMFGTEPNTVGVLSFGVTTIGDCTVLMQPTNNVNTAAITLSGGGLVEGCVVSGSYTGALVSNSAVVRGCQFRGQSGRGVEAAGGVVERNSIAVAGVSGAIGVKVNASTEVRDNTIVGGEAGGQTGISVTGGHTLVSRNSVRKFSAAGSVGVLVTSASAGSNNGTKIQDNDLTNNYQQIGVQSAYNLVVRNTMAHTGAGGALSAVAGNTFGPVVNGGNTDLTNVPASSHPLANLMY